MFPFFSWAQFPYTKSDQINLDWILGKLGIISDKVDNLDAAVTDAQTAATEAAASAASIGDSVTRAEAAADAAEDAVASVTDEAAQAVQTANAAQQTATAAGTAAAAAQQTATTAQATAAQAAEDAAGAQTAAGNAQTAAQAAAASANSAQTAATNAQTAAGNAQTTATSAASTAAAAAETAQGVEALAGYRPGTELAINFWGGGAMTTGNQHIGVTIPLTRAFIGSPSSISFSISTLYIRDRGSYLASYDTSNPPPDNISVQLVGFSECGVSLLLVNPNGWGGVNNSVVGVTLTGTLTIN